MTANNAWANNIAIEKNTSLRDIEITANSEQLEIINTLDMENITIGEFLEKVFPSEFAILNTGEESRNKLFQENIYHRDATKMDISRSHGLPGGSTIWGFNPRGAVHSSWTQRHVAVREMWIFSELVKRDTNTTVNATFRIAYNVPRNTRITTSGSRYNLTPGPYRTRGAHWYTHVGNFGEEWIFFETGTTTLQIQ